MFYFHEQEAYLTSKKGDLIEQEKVVAIQPVHTNRVEIYTTNSKYIAKSVILACGSWSNNLLVPLGLQLPLTVCLCICLFYVYLNYFLKKQERSLVESLRTDVQIFISSLMMQLKLEMGEFSDFKNKNLNNWS